MYLDGISYRIWTSDCEIEASFHMNNPRTASLKAIEQSLFEVASTVQKRTENDQIAVYLNTWQEYLKR